MLSTKSLIEQVGNFAPSSQEQIYRSAQLAAEKRLRKLVGTAVYEEVAADASHAAREVFEHAESILACMYYLPTKNMKAQGDGIEVQSSSHDGTTSILSPKQVAELQASFMQQALQLLEGYVSSAAVLPIKAGLADV